MKLISWNVNGLRACLTHGFADSFAALDADIFSVQETKMQPGQADFAPEGYTEYTYSAEKKGYSGTACWCRQVPLAVTTGIGLEEHDHEGRVLTLEYPGFYLVNCYTPNSQDGLKRLDYRMTWEDAFRAYLPAQEIAEDKSLLKVEGNGFAAFDYTHPGKTSLAAGQVRKLLVTPAFANPELLPNCYVVSPGETLYIPVCKAFGVWEKNEVLAGAGTGMLGAMGARVVWEDVRYLLNDDQITVLGSGSKAVIQVRTTPRTCGNAVLALEIGGEIRWSWHLWITDYDPNAPEAQKSKNGRTFMDRNLGAMNAEYGNIDALGLQYQWGRKDPVPCPAKWEDIATRPVWNGVGVKVGFSTKANSAVIRDNLVASINEPLALIKGLGLPYDWYATEKKQGQNRWCAADGSKTEFDPCPRGWRVPVSGFGTLSPWYNCVTAGIPWLNGVIWEDLGYWPAAGLLETGGQSYLGLFGYYWAATPGEDLAGGVTKEGCAYGYNFDNQTSLTSYLQYRHTVLSVRCVKVQ